MAINIDKEVLKQQLIATVKQRPNGTRISSLGNRLRKRHVWRNLRDADIKALILPMVMSGTLKFTPELKITAAKSKSATKAKG